MNSVIELMRDLGRPRADMWEVGFWEDSMAVDSGEIYLTYQVHNEAIAIPENIDAIRALTAIERDGARSIQKTDKSLGITKDFFSPSSSVSMEESLHPAAAKAVRAAHKTCLCEGFKGSMNPAFGIRTALTDSQWHREKHYDLFQKTKRGTMQWKNTAYGCCRQSCFHFVTSTETLPFAQKTDRRKSGDRRDSDISIEGKRRERRSGVVRKEAKTWNMVGLKGG